MSHRPHYLELPWSFRMAAAESHAARERRRLRWLLAGLLMLALFLIGIGMTWGAR